MLNQTLSTINDLSADYRRIAVQAPWIRCAFTLRDGKIGMFGHGIAGGDGHSDSLLYSTSKQTSPFVTELVWLDEQAGRLMVSLMQSPEFLAKLCAVSGKMHYDVHKPFEFWVVFLLHSPGTAIYCTAKSPDGTESWAFDELDQKELAIWIDNYAQVCVTGLAWVKSALASVPLNEGNHTRAETPPKAERLQFDDLTQTVTLDGTPYSVPDPKGYIFYKQLAAACPKPLTKNELQNVIPGCRGEKKIRELKNALPPALSRTVQSGPNGYWLNLAPPWPKKRKKGRS